jgi:hypothetical protein
VKLLPTSLDVFARFPLFRVEVFFGSFWLFWTCCHECILLLYDLFSFSSNYIIFRFVKKFKKKTDLYVEKVQYSVQAAEFKPTHSSLNPYCFWLVWPKIQQILCESTCDFILFNHYMSNNFKIKNCDAKTETSNYINYSTLLCRTCKGTME